MDLAFSGHLVVLSVFDPSKGLVREILNCPFVKHPLKSYRLTRLNRLKPRLNWTYRFSRVSIDRILVLSWKEVELVNRQEMESHESSIQKLVSRVHQ